jgi:uncharacterized protein YutE (UPF0331/DUF86 family)
MAINKDLIAKKLDFLDHVLTKIEKAEYEMEEFVENPDVHDLITFRLQQAVETCIDIAVHIIAEMKLLRKETAKDAFILLGEKKIITRELSKHMGKAADFRNRVVHGYNDFDFKLLFKDYKDDIKDLRNFGAQIIEFLDEIK